MLQMTSFCIPLCFADHLQCIGDNTAILHGTHSTHTCTCTVGCKMVVKLPVNVHVCCLTLCLSKEWSV